MDSFRNARIEESAGSETSVHEIRICQFPRMEFWRAAREASGSTRLDGFVEFLIGLNRNNAIVSRIFSRVVNVAPENFAGLLFNEHVSCISLAELPLSA